jgi:hypothetical protein
MASVWMILKSLLRQVSMEKKLTLAAITVGVGEPNLGLVSETVDVGVGVAGLREVQEGTDCDSVEKWGIRSARTGGGVKRKVAHVEELADSDSVENGGGSEARTGGAKVLGG